MSFKRDGDDVGLLDRLKHRRVNDLLGEHVPEDEAKLLSNGRLTCLICSHRPIFDTMKILVIHRKGKRHTQELHKYLSHKQKLEFEKSKRIQRENLAKERQINSQILGAKLTTDVSNKSKLSRNKVIDITHKNPASVVSGGCSDSSLVRRYLKDISKKTPLSHVVWCQKESYPESRSQPVDERQQVVLDSQPPVAFQRQPVAISSNLNQEVESIHTSQAKKTSASLLSLHMSGWLRDKHGNLVRDPNAEFDSSDEDTRDSIKDEQN